MSIHLYQHPEIPESGHVWATTSAGDECYQVWFKYPETPEYGVSVTCLRNGFVVKYCKFEGGITTMTGKAYAFERVLEVDEHIDKHYIRDDMEKVLCRLEDLHLSELAPPF